MHEPSADQLETDFIRRLDVSGLWHRVLVAGTALLLTVWLVPEQVWMAALLTSYLLCAALALAMLLRRPWGAWRHRIQNVLLVLDVGTVASCSYAWGTATSALSFMTVPIVVGWTLVPGRPMGRWALALVCVAFGGLLVAETTGLIPVAPAVGQPAPPPPSPGGVLGYYALLATGLVASHALVEIVTRMMHRHAAEVSRLTAEQRAREREQELAEALEENQRLEALGRVSGGVAHDFNNVLTAIIGSAELAVLALDKHPAQTREALQGVLDASEKAEHLTAQLLDFAKGRPTPPGAVDLATATKESAQLLRSVLGSAVELSLVLAHEPLSILADRAGLERVLVNLAVNASDAMPRGGRIDIELDRQTIDGQDYARLAVTDEGEGIAPEHLPHIFEPFFSRRTGRPGSGLGLSSVYGIVTRCGGTIEVLPGRGTGTRFELRWPLLKTQQAALPKTASDSGVGAGHVAPGTRILLVDDDDAVRNVVAQQLEAAGYAVTAVAGGSAALQALDHARSAPFATVLTDLAMPEMSGLQLAEEIRSAWPGLPIVCMSGFHETEPPSEADRQHIHGVLTKPFPATALLETVGSACRGQGPPPN